jgi:toxin ParE1/3/4
VYTVKLLLEAELELTDACAWYEKRRSGLGKSLMDEFDHYVDIIANNPLQFAINFSEKFRFATLKKFPYSIVYRIDDEAAVIIITSVFHQNRNPSKF